MHTEIVAAVGLATCQRELFRTLLRAMIYSQTAFTMKNLKLEALAGVKYNKGYIQWEDICRLEKDQTRRLRLLPSDILYCCLVV